MTNVVVFYVYERTETNRTERVNDITNAIKAAHQVAFLSASPSCKYALILVTLDGPVLRIIGITSRKRIQ